jgi:hypothetical protein
LDIFIQASDNNFGNYRFPNPLPGFFLLLLSPLHEQLEVREKFLCNMKLMVALNSR